jgi:hypothetical protein
MPLTTKQYEVLNFIEQTWLLDGYIPTKEVVTKRRICSDKFYDECYRDTEFREALAQRGVSFSSAENPALSPEQLAVANVLLDRFDGRSRKKKLADMGVATQTLNGWMRDPAFREYYTKRAETQFGDAMPDVITAHIDQAERGDMKAIQLYYEMMGRYSPRQVNVDINMDYIMVRVIEAIQKHVTNPDQIVAVAEELAAISGGPSGHTEELRTPLPVEVVDL